MHNKFEIKGDKKAMKKLFLVLLIVLVFTVACQKEVVVKDDEIDSYYVNEMYGYTIELPEQWKENKDKIRIFEGDYGRKVTFAYPFTHDLIESDGNMVYQDFFSISVVSKFQYNEILADPPVVAIFLAEDGEKVYLLYHPLDNIVMGEENKKLYNDLHLSEDDIFKIFSLNN